MQRNLHKWEELFMDEFFEILADCPLAFFTIAPVEDHGAHNALAVDMAPMYEVALAVAEKTGGIVFPQIPFGLAGAFPSRTHEQIRSGKDNMYFPSMFVSRELVRQIHEEIFEGMARIGFKGCMALGGHGPNIIALDVFRKEHDGAVGAMRMLTPNWPALLRPSELFQECARKCPQAMAHSGVIETALMMYLRPEQVDLSKVMNVLNAPYASQTTLYLKPKDPASNRNIKDNLSDIQKYVTADLGKAVFDYLVDVIAELARAEFDFCKSPIKIV